MLIILFLQRNMGIFFLVMIGIRNKEDYIYFSTDDQDKNQKVERYLQINVMNALKSSQLQKKEKKRNIHWF